MSRSSAESEYRSIAYACTETTWVCFLLGELGVRLTTPILLHCDNLSVTYLAANPVHHARARHIEIDYHFVHENVAFGSHCVCYIPFTDQSADLLAKALHQPRDGLLCSKLVRSSSSSVQGRVRL